MDIVHNKRKRNQSQHTHISDEGDFAISFVDDKSPISRHHQEAMRPQRMAKVEYPSEYHDQRAKIGAQQKANEERMQVLRAKSNAQKAQAEADRQRARTEMQARLGRQKAMRISTTEDQASVGGAKDAYAQEVSQPREQESPRRIELQERNDRNEKSEQSKSWAQVSQERYLQSEKVRVAEHNAQHSPEQEITFAGSIQSIHEIPQLDLPTSERTQMGTESYESYAIESADASEQKEDKEMLVLHEKESVRQLGIQHFDWGQTATPTAPATKKGRQKKVYGEDEFSLRHVFAQAVERDGVRLRWQTAFGRTGMQFAIAIIGIYSIFSGALFVGNAFAVKERVEDGAHQAIEALKQSADATRGGNLGAAASHVNESHNLFLQAQKDLDAMNSIVIAASRYVPGASKLASGDALVEASVHLTSLAAEMTMLSGELENIIGGTEDVSIENFSTAEVINAFFGRSDKMLAEIKKAQSAMERVNAADVPEEQRNEYIRLARLIAPMVDLLEEVVLLEDAIKDIFGVNGPRTYLMLFQNNHEMRGSGGFIGSYGFLDIAAGRVREFKIDGIYNPDGQLIDKVVPPRPIQKISAAWSLHDSNWWPHFPKSAEKAINFYARTGGPSVDGVFAMTPVMVERLLDVTGPITIPEYDVTLSSENFISTTQYKVEVDYDKEENRPKKILSDFMPLLLGELKRDMNIAKAHSIAQVFLDGLNERHMMLYMRNDEIQSMIAREQWGGQLLETSDDYLSVVHSNINGFKTDGIITEDIAHKTELQADGRMINTVTVTRTHGGGDTGYEWWDAVNADYMRVYVPQGARLLDASGHTREWHEPRLDYEALGFEIDPDVEKEEQQVYVHDESGTRIYDDAGKTVFGNWVYVSPGEKVSVTYVYELPWRFVTSQDADGRFASHSVLFQKQAGAQNVTLNSDIILAEGMNVVHDIPLLQEVGGDSGLASQQDFQSDAYRGFIFRQK